jgi:hypothetical protein
MRQLRNSDVTEQVTRIHHNDVSNFMLQDNDGGAFYVGTGADGRFVRIDHNWFHIDDGRTEGQVFGAYWDYSKNYVLDHNVMWGVLEGIHINESEPSNILAYNNTIDAGFQWWGAPIGAAIAEGSIFHDNIVTVLYNPVINMNQYPVYGRGEASGNLVVNPRPDLGNRDGWGLTGGDVETADAGFVNQEARNYALQASSPALDRGSAMSTVTIEGIEVAAFNEPAFGGAPDKGAYEYGAEPWTVGAPTDVGAPAAGVLMPAPGRPGSGGSSSAAGGAGAATGVANGRGDVGTRGDAANSAAPSSASELEGNCSCRMTARTHGRVSVWLVGLAIAGASLLRRRGVLREQRVHGPRS